MENPEKEERFWFKNKKYGIGWAPATWEGWSVLLGYIVGVIFLVAEPYYLGDGKFITGDDVYDVDSSPFNFVYFFALFFLFMVIVIKKGEKLRPNFISKFYNKFKGNEQVKEMGDREN